jgi:putative ABC transport system permease protein
VLEAEAIRVVGAQLRHGHRSRRVVVFGLSPDARLQRLLDIDMREVALPAQGLVLGGGLARLLGVTPGDSVRVEFLEGERRVRQVPVVSTMEEPIGLYAYMDERALADLMSEGLAYTDAYLRVDRTQLDALYRYLKQVPVISGVTLREATLQSFLDTIAENFLISTWILIGFACAIAAGVVYNGARLALSEHAITLASLRVLGFTRREVTGILLGEQALVTLAAIPVGCAIGYGLCAWLSSLLETELYRLPLTVSLRTYIYASGAIVIASLASGAVVAWRLRRLDLVAVLKTRE